MSANPNIHFSSTSGEWETPLVLFDLLDREFGFELDVCATSANYKVLPYFDPQDNGLAQPWGPGPCWMNPPYGREIKQWVKKAYSESLLGTIVVCLLPARTDTRWWWQWVIKGEIRFLPGRLKFGDSSNSAPFPSAVVIFDYTEPPKVVWWDYKLELRG